MLITTFIGWMALPVTNYPSNVISPDGFSIEVIGTLLPSDLPLPKSLVVAVVVFLALIAKAPTAFRQLSPTRYDAAILLFCLSPLLAAAVGRTTFGTAGEQAGYLAGTWGATWMTGRLMLGDDPGRNALVKTIAASGLFLVPVAIVEGYGAPWLYPYFYGPHPFIADGAQRFAGYRPLGFFEHGNQYGMWISMAALAAVSLALKRKPGSRLEVPVAVVLVACAIASQSVGAILLLLLGTAAILASRRMRQLGIVAAAVIVALFGTAYVSGKVPLRSWALETPSGQAVTALLRKTGRQSLAWRVQRDQLAVGMIQRAPLTGYGTWDWWRPLKSHPWGLPQLLAGQFGVLALAFSAFALLGGAVRQIWRGSTNPLPFIVVLAAVDAWLNSAAYLPAILAAAALAARPRSRMVCPADGNAASAGASAPTLVDRN